MLLINMDVSIKTIATTLSIMLLIGATVNILTSSVLLAIYHISVTSIIVYSLVIIPLSAGMLMISYLLYKIVN